ncbi:COG5377 Phage-related protein, predicted endonuclease [uncultured Caudovirales phage]|uniref:COG5377 Phage-related protein, predicted endonuclease n=1 Tax=uncultured Caudovirales phage TaxID=2100421 RepID=A0A6J5LHC4_9CAUD|nr:COG5377 Phage-related protein, predicted endonuclease [uncultured Caudovirales phage]
MSAVAVEIIQDLEQGSAEWLKLRKTKITATDAAIIMGANHWKTRLQLYHEKLSEENNTFKNDAMQRGIDLEPIARELFEIKTGISMCPQIVVNDWAMASLDGMDSSGTKILEIKCPGPKDHAIALSGKVPDHYYPQLQHQMYVCDVQLVYYFSFDGADGVIVEVPRDEEYLEKLIAEEFKFYMCLQNKTPPEPQEGDYIEREDALWQQCALKWKSLNESIKELEREEEETRKQLIFLSGESNTKGGGISLCQVQRKGNVDYAKIPELKGVDLDKYRKGSITSWRITCS